MEENRKQEFEQLKQEYLQTEAPKGGEEHMLKGIERAKKEKAEKKRIHFWKKSGAVAAAALAIFVVTPNVSPAAARVMEQIPLIGRAVSVVTIRDYQVDEGNYQADVAVPKAELADENGTVRAVEQVNRSAEEYIDTLISEFEKDMEEIPDGHKGLNVDYEVVTDTDTWFTLKISVLETQASGYQHEKYYHMDKIAGETAELKDLFRADADYGTVIGENVKAQMAEQMKEDESRVFWPEDVTIGEDQNFYFNGDGQLVIVFDEYEAAPGYMGVQEFVIPEAVVKEISVAAEQAGQPRP